MPISRLKFSQDGVPLYFPGNTVICRISPKCSQFGLLATACQRLQSNSVMKKYAFLPATSFHMTVFEGVCDRIRLPAYWTSKVPLDAPLEEVDRYFASEWSRISKPERIEMQYGTVKTRPTLGIELIPATEESRNELKKFREACATTFGVRQPDHETYRFHITLAYQFRELDPIEIARLSILTYRLDRYLKNKFGLLNLARPELTFFADMTQFTATRADAKRNCIS